MPTWSVSLAEGPEPNPSFKRAGTSRIRLSLILHGQNVLTGFRQRWNNLGGLALWGMGGIEEGDLELKRVAVPTGRVA